MTTINYQPKVGFCQSCCTPLNEPGSLVIEYWVAEKTVFFCWCHACGWKGEISDVVKFTMTEIEGEE